MYQHSAVGRDIIVDILASLGAEVIPILRSDTFVPIDTENVNAPEKTLFKQIVSDHQDAFAIVSTDGDSDRPFVIDETGEFHRGDVLGLIVSGYLGAQSVAVPISSNDAVIQYCKAKGIELECTKIGSPYVIVAMRESSVSPAVGWEVNGGFLTGDDIELNGKILTSLPTRDAVLPILCALVAAVQASQKVSDVFATLPKRFTGGGLIDNVPEDQIAAFKTVSTNTTEMQRLADVVFEGSGMGKAILDITDGLRISFTSGDVIHLRPSGNAPQFRVYTNADTQQRAEELVEQALDQNGYITALLAQLVA